MMGLNRTLYATVTFLTAVSAVPEKFARSMHRNTALVIIDMQNDFISGAFNNTRAPTILPQLYHLLDNHQWPLIIASQDWHPQGHVSFASAHEGRLPGAIIEIPFLDEPSRDKQSQLLYKDHCIPGTWGAELEDGLKSRLQRLEGFYTSVHYIKKAQDPAIDSYSAFADNQHSHYTTLADELHAHQIERVVLTGTVTSGCVRGTAMDGVKLGFDITLLSDATEGISDASKAAALEDLEKFGVFVMTSAQWEAENTRR